MQNFTCLPGLILRTPIYSFCDYRPEKLPSLLKDPFFIAAIYLASPQLHKIVEDANYDIQFLNKSQQLSLLKYANRMHYRPTPFGSFSAFSVTQWDECNQIQLAGLTDLKFHVEWDHEISLKLSSAHNIEKWEDELLYVNHTLYEIKDEYRYMRTHFNFETRIINFSLEALYADPLIKEVLSLVEPTKTTRQLLATLCEQLNFRPDEAYDYVLFLLETQLLLPDSHPKVLGASTTAPGIINKPALDLPDLKKAKAAQNMLNHVFEKNHLTAPQHTFYVNTQRLVSGGLNPAIQNQLSPVLEVLSKMQTPQIPSALKLFIEAFKARYDQEEVPLLNALDPESGIDYANLAIKSTTNELLADLDFSSAEPVSNNISWVAMHQLLLRKWNKQTASIPEIILDLDEPEIREQNKTTINMPPSVAVMFRVLGDQILLESAGGVTGCSLIGRFANFDLELKSIARKITSAEQAINPNVVFAEIGQLSGMHVDNINKRPHLYDYEIPVNTISSLPAKNQIQLKDLYLSVKGNRLVIRNKKLGKEIIPRLTSAYNYTHTDLALFRFLCDMQYQGVQSNLGFSIDSFFPGLSAYPRVKIGNVIISPAKWFLTEPEIQKIGKSMGDFNEIRQQKCWPQYIALTQNDQQLVFNLSIDADISLFQSCIHTLKNLQIQEYFLSDKTVKSHYNKPVINQFIAFYLNNKPSYNPLLPGVTNNQPDIERNFSLGSEWIYLKIYCHEHSANNLFGNELLNFLNRPDLHIIKKWFFIRYTDPKPHIRLRIQAETKHLGLILKKLNDALKENIEYNIIQGYQADIYRREVERYSSLLMDEVETVFYYSSKLICRYIKQLNTVPNTFSYYSLALVSFYDIINLFSDFIPDEITFTNAIAKSLYSEFSNTKNLQISLDQKYRGMKLEIEQLLNNNTLYNQLKLDKEFDEFTDACIILKNKALNINNDQKISLVADIIHMHLNRIFFEQQRKQELCIYHILHKYYTAQKAKARQKETTYAI
ncbi:lantibiotic dehydratase [Mucilaginibacter jinjuensis]|uniref:Lantibiotic dehydratase n=1 Tax=Mucilaginibacter jinjuensis TaxID=1176721 RepID=A0ABY7TA53_9SPHI|nr:lantibiotic dehydratase [Mucilaginibacter jinjuensis]WCT12082.1 lantibiotic dehydratase [Mucilaginibacter jinjuensis]